MAPEVLRGEPATPAADIYALGVVMYEMATARRPFAGKTDAALISDILERQPPPPRQLNPVTPRSLNDLIVRLLAKEPARRPTIESVKSELSEMAAGRQQKKQR
jgi:serine/threonine-protein kinase